MSEFRMKEASREQMRRAARLHSRSQRQRWKQTLVEGPQSVRELLVHAPQLVRDLYVTERALETHSDIAKLAAQTGVWTHLLTDEELSQLSTDAQGLLAVIDEPEKASTSAALANARLVIAAAHISDPGNLGTIIRVADAAGADAVLIGKGSVELYSPKTIRSTAGSLFHLPTVTGLTFEEICTHGREAGLHVLGADAAGQWSLSNLVGELTPLETEPSDTVTHTPPKLSEPTMWVLGHEAHGFEGFDTSLLDGTVSIPIFGKAESLNVSMAATILTYACALATMNTTD
ncbi:MAG: RNA methyltransferase [Actinomycetaceae bacterium]|nr:RNA methyltransferase [Actinomycetaceae bacterium]